MQLKRVNRLRNGSVIGVFSPSEPIVESRRSSFNNGISILNKHGFKVILGKNVFSQSSYMAGEVEQRICDIHELLANPEIDAVISSWGGKSCNQLVDKLDYELISRSRKPVLGFSDPCVLMNHITARTGLVTFYGPNVVGKLNETTHANMQVLRKSETGRNLLSDKCYQKKTIKSGICKGRLFGGNLSTFVLGIACGILEMSFFDGGIFFWEDMNTPQIINQHLTALKNIGLFNRISGMVVGKIISTENKEWKIVDPIDDVGKYFQSYGFPVLYMPLFGHENLANPIIPIGALAELNTNNFTLTLMEDILE